MPAIPPPLNAYPFLDRTQRNELDAVPEWNQQVGAWLILARDDNLGVWEQRLMPCGECVDGCVPCIDSTQHPALERCQNCHFNDFSCGSETAEHQPKLSAVNRVTKPVTGDSSAAVKTTIVVAQIIDLLQDDEDDAPPSYPGPSSTPPPQAAPPPPTAPFPTATIPPSSAEHAPPVASPSTESPSRSQVVHATAASSSSPSRPSRDMVYSPAYVRSLLAAAARTAAPGMNLIASHTFASRSPDESVWNVTVVPQGMSSGWLVLVFNKTEGLVFHGQNPQGALSRAYGITRNLVRYKAAHQATLGGSFGGLHAATIAIWVSRQWRESYAFRFRVDEHLAAAEHTLLLNGETPAFAALRVEGPASLKSLPGFRCRPH